MCIFFLNKMFILCNCLLLLCSVSLDIFIDILHIFFSGDYTSHTLVCFRIKPIRPYESVANIFSFNYQ